MFKVRWAVRGSAMPAIRNCRGVSLSPNYVLSCLVLVPREVLVTRVTDLHLLCDTEMRKREGLGRAFLVEDAPTITTVVLSIGE